VEEDYQEGTKVEVKIDGYNLTIAANLTKNVNPQMLNYCIK